MKFNEYDFEIKKIKEKAKGKSVLLQLPDGLKPFATKIADIIGGKVYIWAGSCFGACDIPNVKVDLIIQFGHSRIKQLE